MNFVRFCVERPVAVVVIAVLTVMAGLLSLSAAPIQLTPEIQPTFVSVTTFWDGASPAEVESEILIEQEEKLRGVANLVKMTSVARQNEGVIRLEFKVGADKEAVLREVSDKLREVPEYPENVDEPVVEAGDFSSRDFIAWIIVRCPDDNYDVRDSYDFYFDRVKPFLERVPGVSEIGVLIGQLGAAVAAEAAGDVGAGMPGRRRAGDDAPVGRLDREPGNSGRAAGPPAVGAMAQGGVLGRAMGLIADPAAEASACQHVGTPSGRSHRCRT